MMLRLTRGLLSRQASKRVSMYSGLVREQSFENHSTIDPELREFVSEAFDIFDLNNDKVIELHEVQKAYSENEASAEMIRLLEKYKLNEKPVTSDTIRTFDLMQAVKRRACGTWDGGGVITEEMFEKWLVGQIEKNNNT